MNVPVIKRKIFKANILFFIFFAEKNRGNKKTTQYKERPYYQVIIKKINYGRKI